jgi:hypothetical protein
MNRKALFNGVGGRPFDAETLQNYGLGYKSTWWGDRLRLNAAVIRLRAAFDRRSSHGHRRRSSRRNIP